MANSIKKFESFLDEFLNFEKTPCKNIFWLETMKFLCSKFNNPQNFAPCFHVAGSKGKGSVSAFIANILDVAGFKTGLYTSPHIIDFIERISSANGPFSDDVYDISVDEFMNTINKIDKNEFPLNRPVTWFELVTLFSFIVFKNAHVDYSVYEVGLGGRLDSTNVIKPLCSCITQIELEHTEFLGDTIEKIAYEKGGIIKQNTNVVIAPCLPTVRKVFKNIAKDKNATIYFVDDLIKKLKFKTKFDNFALTNVSFDCEKLNLHINANLKMIGSFQAQNAALASIAIRLSVPQISDEQIIKGLEKTVLPARFEIVDNLIFDGAHTVNSVKSTLETLETLYQSSNKKKYLLFACASDKDMDKIAILFKNKFDKVFLTKPGNVKQSDINKLSKAFDNANIDYVCNEDFNAQIKNAITMSKNDNAILLITGSFYLASEAKKLLAV